MNIHLLNYRLYLFLGAFLIVASNSLWIVRSSHFAGNAELLSLALTIDLAVLIPALFYLIMRRGGISALSVIPVFVVAIVLATLIIPPEHHRYLDLVKLALVPLELFVVAWIAYRAFLIMRDQSRSVNPDFVDSIRTVLQRQIRPGFVSSLFASEISMFYYAFCGWGRPAQAGASDGAFTYHKKSGYAAVVWVFVFLILMEAVVIHLVLQRWSVVAAWVLTILSIYGLLFILADLNAVRLRPILVDDEFLYLRIGLRWNAKIHRRSIAGVRTIRSVDGDAENLNAALLGFPNVEIRFEEPQEIVGLYGFTKRVPGVSVAVDEPRALQDVLKSSAIEAPRFPREDLGE